MAGEFNGFYIFEIVGLNRRLKGLYGTQANANAAAQGDTDLTANVGSVAFPNEIAIGWIWDVGNSEWRQEGNAELTLVDRLRTAASDMLDVFETGIEYIIKNRAAWPQHQVEWAITGIHWQTVNAARIALNSTRTIAYRQKFCEEAASWPSGVNGHIRQYVDSFDADSITTAPGSDFSWVTTDDPSVREPTSEAYGSFTTTTNVEDAPSSAKLIGRGWTTDIPV